MKKILILSFFLILLSYNGVAQNYDVVVYGSSSAGVIAATKVARMGKKVLLISNTNHIGGLTASGLGATDLNKPTHIGGMSREFYKRIYDYYMNPEVWTAQTRKDYFDHIGKRIFGGKNEKLGIQWAFEPKVAEKVFNDMLHEKNVKVVYGQRLLLSKSGVVKSGTKIRTIIMESGQKYSAKVFIDATYEGDLMAMAGVSYHMGREANSQYNETYNGIHVSFKEKFDPYLIEGDSKSGLLPFIEPKSPGANGQADNRVQAYCYRFPLTTNKNNWLEVKKPLNYNPLWFEHYARIAEDTDSLTLKKFITISPLPNKKTDINHCDFIGASYTWAESNYRERDSIAQMHKDYALGKIWFLGNDPRIPERIRQEMKSYGIPKDEFLDTENFPFQLYVREARRMVGSYVMTENNVNKTITSNRSIGLGTYMLDVHYVSRFVDDKGDLYCEGTFAQNYGSYPIDYLSITPKKEDCVNLIVPVCLSSSHAAYGSIRMEPVFMSLAEAAAVAAVFSIDARSNVQDVSYEHLRSRLLNDGLVLDVPEIQTAKENE